MIHFCPFKNVGGYSESTLGRSCWTIAGRVVTTLIIKRDRHVRDCNKSPKGHWSLTWIQWRLLFYLDFLANQKAWLPYLWNQSEQQQWRYINSGYGDAFGLLLLHSDLKKKSFGEKAPHWLFNVPPVMYASGIYVTGLVPCLVNAVDFLLYKYTGQSNALKSILICWKAVGEGSCYLKCTVLTDWIKTR